MEYWYPLAVASDIYLSREDLGKSGVRGERGIMEDTCAKGTLLAAACVDESDHLTVDAGDSDSDSDEEVEPGGGARENF